MFSSFSPKNSANLDCVSLSANASLASASALDAIRPRRGCGGEQSHGRETCSDTQERTRAQ